MNTSAIQIFTTKNGKTGIEVTFEKETVWLSLNHMIELFERNKSLISRHINDIFKDNELDKNSFVVKQQLLANVKINKTMENKIQIISLTPENIANYGVCSYMDINKHKELKQ